VEEYEKAIADGKAAIAKNPEYIKGYLRTAGAMREIDLVDEALALFEKAPAKVREDAAVHTLLDGLKHDYQEDHVLPAGDITSDL
jgi:hypothetical protein